MSAIPRLQAIRNNKIFETFIIIIIVTSAMLVGAKTYDLPPSMLEILRVLDWVVTLIFLFEIGIRFAAEEKKANFFRSAWNIFDTLIVVVSLIPIEDTEMVLVARLVRVFRVMRMISFIPELRLLLNSLLIALPRLGYVMLLMFIIFYIYAAVGSLFFENINSFLWGDIARAMLTLFRVMTFEDWTDVMYEVMEVYAWSWVYFVSFIFLTAFAFLNMVIGIVVNVLEEEHQREVENDPNQVSLSDLKVEIESLKRLIEEQHK
ncbi:MAG: ion transporter [Pseudomonadales bacterium]|nr:ion transporter [Pseudomonadales bacterium]MDG1444538.1 ion transporter [Pseudomonadales bacterium]